MITKVIFPIFVWGIMLKRVSKTGWKLGKKKEVHKGFRLGNWLLATLIITTFSFLLIFFGGRQIVFIGQSMEPSIYHEDVCMINRLQGIMGSYHRDDVILFYPQGDTQFRPTIKRIIGLPGERIHIKDGQIYIDGKVLSQYQDLEKIEYPGRAQEEILLGRDEYFVLGDNIDSSEDSRSNIVGTVKKQDIIGGIWFVLAPKEHRGLVE